MNGKENIDTDTPTSHPSVQATTAATVSLPSSIAGNTGTHPDAVHSLHRTVTSLRSAKIVRLSETATLYDCCVAMTENRVDAVLLTLDGNDMILRGILTDKVGPKLWHNVFFSFCYQKHGYILSTLSPLCRLFISSAGYCPHNFHV